jgi:ribosomal protein S18 acetylase RimI-like enzyme
MADRVSLDLARVEEAGLNALQTQRQMFYDGWLLRLSPGKARRARSVNAHFGSTRPLAGKIAYCERVYAAHRLPILFRMTPFQQPPELEAALAARGYVEFDPTLVQVAELERPPPDEGADVALTSPPVDAFVDAVARLRGSTPQQRDAHYERLRNTALTVHPVLAVENGEPLATGQAVLDDGLVGIFDVVTADRARGRGLATRVVTQLLTWAWERGAAHAHLQVDAANAPALAVYRKFGFATAYRYHYRGRPGAGS